MSEGKALLLWLASFGAGSPATLADCLEDPQPIAACAARILGDSHSDTHSDSSVDVGHISAIARRLDAFFVRRLARYNRANRAQLLGEGVAALADGQKRDGVSPKDVEMIIKLLLGAIALMDDNSAVVELMQELDFDVQRELGAMLQDMIQKQAMFSLEDDSNAFYVNSAPSAEDSSAVSMFSSSSLPASHVAAIEQELRLKEDMLSNVTAELSSLRHDNQAFAEQVQSLEKLSTSRGLEIQQLQAVLAQRKGDAELGPRMVSEDQLEAAIADRQRLSEDLAAREKSIVQLQRRCEDLAERASVVPQLRDQLEAVQEKASMADTLLQRVEHLRQRAESADELRIQLKELQQQQSRDAGQGTADDALRRLQAAKSQVTKYKTQLTDLTVENTALRDASTRAETQCTILIRERTEATAQLETLKTQVERLEERLISQRQEHEQEMAQLVQQQQASTGDASAQSFMQDIQDRLEREERAHRDTVQELTDDLDDARRLAERYKTELDIAREAAPGDASVTSALQAELDELRELYAKLQSANKASELENKHLKEVNELLRNSSGGDAAQPSVDSAESQKLRESLQTAQRDNAKLEGYLRTAKVMIRDERNKVTALQDQLAASSAHDGNKVDDAVMQRVRSELHSKEVEVERLRQVMADSKESALREQRLLASALHELGADNARLRDAARRQVSIIPSQVIATAPASTKAAADHHGSATLAAAAADDTGAPLSLLAQRQNAKR